MKNKIKALLLISAIISCCMAKNDNASSNTKNCSFVFNQIYYWDKNTINSFYAMKFDSTDHLYCTIFSFGNSNLNSENKYIVKTNDTMSVELVNSKNGETAATITCITKHTFELHFNDSPN